MNRITLMGSLFFLAFAGIVAAQTRPLAPEDANRVKSVTDVQLSPDGTTVAYVVTTTDMAKNRRVPAIWMVAADGSSEPKPFISDIPARAPRWSPDGKWLAFVSNSTPPQQSDSESAKPAQPPAATPRNQVWLVSRDGKGRRAITHMPGGTTAFSWSPDGTHLAVLARQAAGTHDVRHYTTMIYKLDGAGWMDETRNHIYIVDVKDGAARQLTTGDDSNDSDPRWSHDGKSIVYVSELNGTELRDTFNNGGIMVVPSAGGTPRKVCQRRAYVGLPSWSPNDSQIAYAASPTPADQPVLWVTNVADPSKAKVGSDADLFPDEIEWEENAIWFGAHDHGAAPLFRINVPGTHAVKVVGGDRAAHNLQVSDAKRRIVYLENDDTHPPEIFTSDENGAHEKQLTFHNREFLSQLQLGTSKRVSWKSPDGLTIEGFLMKPVGWQAGKKYPMILGIHGGPNGMFGFHWEVDEQLFAGNGYAVLLTNPRGSSGYGAKFQRGVNLEWGGKAYQDIISGVESVLSHNNWIDRDRLGVVGHSYGGFMTNWIVTQTNIFKAAISISGITDFISDEGTRDAAYGHSRDFGGDVFDHFDTYWKYSPVRLAAKVKTPILFLHGEADQRVPVSQAEEYFRAIKHFGGTAEIVIFPRESHMLPVTSEPKHLVETYQWRVYWFDRYVKGNAEAVPPGMRAADSHSTQ